VDFLVQIGREVWAIEVKAARQVDSRAAKALNTLTAREIRGLKRRVVVFLGPRRQRIGDADALPLREFLKELPR